MSPSTPGYRYQYDIAKGTLHDLASPKNPTNDGCHLDAIEDWVSFDVRSSLAEGITIRKLTATREVMDIKVKSLCPHCIENPKESEELVGLLQDYFLKHHDD